MQDHPVTKSSVHPQWNALVRTDLFREEFETFGQHFHRLAERNLAAPHRDRVVLVGGDGGEVVLEVP